MTKQQKHNRRVARICGNLIRLAGKRTKLWNAACAADGVPTDSNFVVFSPDNKAAQDYNNFMLKQMAVR